MFTGIIEEVGMLRHIEKSDETMILEIEAKKVLTDIHIGDSIAINGVCLTVVQFNSHTFKADVMPETYRKTTLNCCKPGDRINLERAMSAQGRFGGHMVQGHVDGTGTVISRTPDGNAVIFTIEANRADLTAQMIPKGSVALDGISLTLVEVKEKTFTVSIIPHTLEATVLKDRKPGDAVNIECDMMGKYIKRFLDQMLKEKNIEKIKETDKSEITEQFLRQQGFITS